MPGSGRSPGKGNDLPTPLFWPGEFHGQRSLVGNSPWGCKELDTTERLTFSLIKRKREKERERERDKQRQTERKNQSMDTLPYIQYFLITQSVKNLPAIQESACNAENVGLIPVSGRSPGEENGNPSQYSCLGNSMDRETWQATVHGATRVSQDLAMKPPAALYEYKGQ